MNEPGYLKKGYKLRRASSRLSRTGVLLSVLFLLLAVYSGLGSQRGYWHFRTGFTILKIAAFGGVLSLSLSLAGLIVCLVRRATVKGAVAALIGIMISLPVVLVPLKWSLEAKRVPRIHDITTDTANPPRFTAFPTIRPTPPEYPGGEVAEAQRKAYPEVQPLRLKVAPEGAFDAALGAAKELGWEVIEADRPHLHIEAVDTTFWYGFKDDIAVRISPEDGRSKIDVRSVSRVGISDIGANARRIRAYFDEVRERAPG